MQYSTKLKHTLLASLLIIAFAQMNLDLFAEGFKVAMGICCLAAAAYLVQTVSIFLTILLVDIGVFFTRVIAELAGGSTLHASILHSYPELIFYLTAGLLIWVLLKITDRSIGQVLYALVVCGIDFLSNLLELLIRLGSSGITGRILIIIAAVAVIRGAALLIMLVIANEYRLTLLQRANAEQYQNMMLLMSRLQGEVAWLEKGSLAVEQIMTEAYDLYNELDKAGAPKELVRSALNISKDVHEVKKEYYMIVRGIRDVIDTEPPGRGIDVKHLLMLIGDAHMNKTKGSDVVPDIRIDCDDGISTGVPYIMLSVFNNLVTNAIEAFGEMPQENKRKPVINITGRKEAESYVFTVSDNGPGVSPDIAEHIFQPGYSTKIDYETGVVGRGLGLAIVHDIVTNSLQGTIDLQSDENGTTFEINIPKTNFMENGNDKNTVTG